MVSSGKDWNGWNLTSEQLYYRLQVLEEINEKTPWEWRLIIDEGQYFDLGDKYSSQRGTISYRRMNCSTNDEGPPFELYLRGVNPINYDVTVTGESIDEVLEKAKQEIRNEGEKQREKLNQLEEFLDNELY